MTVFKCKMCGGTVEFNSGDSIGVCDSCGTKQTLPRLDDDRRANLYDRANHFRRNNEFDKASGLYEQILAEDKTDAEAYWSLVLCRYGIEYVEDPAANKRIPTVNRAQYTSVYDDENYKSALQYADRFQKDLYEEEANSINEIQRGILDISQKEEPFDVFICYKETDNNGRRTPDSVLATDLYHQLTKEGYHVFFSRITLEDKIGTAYEPYIFAALNSAKVMVVLGTKAEYFNSVWVKNEWSRYLALVKEGDGKKVLIPAYRDMDSYDLPEEFSHLQAQDMSKLGFMQDLVRGIQKIIEKEEEKKNAVEKEVVTAGNVNVASLLKRVTLFLEDGSFSDANKYCERVLDQDPENAEAYLGKLMAERRVNKTEELLQCSDPLDKSNNYTKILRFGDNELTSILQEYNALIKERNEQERIKTVYQNAVVGMQAADSETAYLEVAKEFGSITGYKDSAELEQSCLQAAEKCKEEETERIKREAEELRKQELEREYKKVNKLYNELNSVNYIHGAEGIRALLLSCTSVVNADEVNKRVDERINIIKREEEERKLKKAKKIKTITILSIVVSLLFVAAIILGPTSMIYNKNVKRLKTAITNKGNIDISEISRAKESFSKISFFGNSAKYEKYCKAVIEIQGGMFSADEILSLLDGVDVLDSNRIKNEIKEGAKRAYVLERNSIAKVIVIDHGKAEEWRYDMDQKTNEWINPRKIRTGELFFYNDNDTEYGYTMASIRLKDDKHYDQYNYDERYDCFENYKRDDKWISN